MLPEEPADTIPLRKGTEPAASSDTIPLRPDKPTAPAEPTKTLPKPKTYSEAQTRHVLGDVVTDKLKSAEGGGDALQRLSNGSHQQYADLANALDVKKPKALAAKNGPDWTATELRRSSLTHGKELNPLKEQIARHMVENHSPTEILQHTEHWVNPDAQPIKPMSSLTEKVMQSLNLSPEAKNQMRMSGVSDTEAQSLLSKLSARQLENLGNKQA
jgi:hypothetical protein